MFSRSAVITRVSRDREQITLRTTAVPRVVRDSQKSEVGFLDDFRPRITMGNPIVTEILGFSDVGFSKNEKFSPKKSKK